MTDLIPLAIAAATVLAVVVVLRLRKRSRTDNLTSTVNGSRGRPGADKH